MSTLSSRRLSLARGTAIRIPPRRRLRPFSTFEKVIVANSGIILFDTAAGWWITQHNPETYHYLIDTAFIALAALVGLAINFLLLRAAFAPLHGVLATIRAVERGELEARAAARERDPDALALARGFNAMLDRLEEARHELAPRVLQAQEEERRRLALELHDQTGQSLTALTLHAEAIARGLALGTPTAYEHAQQQAERLGMLAQRTLAEVQALSRQLRPPMLDDLGLPAALRWLAEDASQRLHVAVRVSVRLDDADRLPGEVETALYRIAQETLTNAVRHGHARNVRMLLRQRGGAAAMAALTVADDGQGFVTAAGRPATPHQRLHTGLGLEGMHERTRLLGGSLALRAALGRGCVVRAMIPLDGDRAAADAVTYPTADAAVARGGGHARAATRG
jgi:two-component system, NarL family, sensor histidine kinase UhpB